jgi:hypothetical protein
MSPKTFIWIGAIIGGFVGGYIPILFGVGEISISSIVWSTVGSVLGIWGAYKLTRVL